jgi:hypothetical protein
MRTVAASANDAYLPAIDVLERFSVNTQRGRKPMHRLAFSSSATLAAAVVLMAATASPADARIECQGNFQATKYGMIATPYCQEENIARVARSYGMKVTGAQVRNDPLKKVYLCQVIGGDSRLKGACGAYAPDQYR